MLAVCIACVSARVCSRIAASNDESEARAARTTNTKIATYTFNGLPNSKLADASYSSTSNATDIAGNLAGGVAYNFIYAGGTGGHSFYVRRSAGGACRCSSDA